MTAAARKPRGRKPGAEAQHPAFDAAEALSHLYSSTEVATLTNREPITVRALAARHGIGVLKGGRRFFTEADVDRIRAINPLGGRQPDSGRPIQYNRTPEEVQKGRPRKVDPTRAPDGAPAAAAPPPPPQEYTTQQAAELVGKPAAWVSRHALNRQIGTRDGRARTFRDADIEKLRQIAER